MSHPLPQPSTKLFQAEYQEFSNLQGVPLKMHQLPIATEGLQRVRRVWRVRRDLRVRRELERSEESVELEESRIQRAFTISSVNFWPCLNLSLAQQFQTLQQLTWHYISTGCPKKNFPLAHFWVFQLGRGVFRGKK